MTTSVDVNSNVSFGCISHNTIYANPEIYKHEFTYNEKNAISSAVCFNYFNPSKKANLTITSNNKKIKATNADSKICKKEKPKK